MDYGCYLYKDGSMGADYNTEKAKQVLVENGWEYKNNRWQKLIDRRNVRLDFDLVVWKDNGERLKAAEIIQEQLQAIGIKVTLRKVNNDQYNSCLQRKSYDLMVSGVYNSYSPELDYFLGEGNYEKLPENLSEAANIAESSEFLKRYIDEGLLKLAVNDAKANWKEYSSEYDKELYEEKKYFYSL